MSTSEICNDGASKSNDDGVCEVNVMLQNMSTVDKDMLVCANCGKEGGDVNNTCNKCKMVKYCNAICKKVHKKKHKKQCEELIRLAAEKHNEERRIAAGLYDEKLFRPPPALFGDCPICFLLLPSMDSGRRYKTCCGKVICSGCSYAPVYDSQGNKLDIDKQNECAFCRTLAPKTNEEMMKREKKRIEANDAIAIYNLGCDCRDGSSGQPQDYTKALELFHRAGELGHAKAYKNIGNAYYYGRGVEVDKQKATRYYELAAMRGNVVARHNLGIMEENEGNMNRAIKHYMIAVGSGHNISLNEIKDLYSKGHATKEDYTKALQLYQEYLGEITSVQRDKAAAADDQYRYY